METNHTPTPWFAKREGFSTVYIESRIRPGVLQEVAACGPTEGGSDEQEANAAFIVRAANSHDQLVAALKRFTAYGKTFAYREADGCPIEQAFAALAAAGA